MGPPEYLCKYYSILPCYIKYCMLYRVTPKCLPKYNCNHHSGTLSKQRNEINTNNDMIYTLKVKINFKFKEIFSEFAVITFG